MELGITLMDDAHMAELAGRFGRKRQPTDVLAFPMGLGDLLGDVVISLETAERQARRRGIGLDREVRGLLVHGIVHLAGMDHEASEADARLMRALERHLEWELDRAA